MRNIIERLITEKVGFHFSDAQEEDDIIVIDVDNYCIEFANSDDEDYWSFDESLQEEIKDLPPHTKTIYDDGKIYVKIK